MTEQNPDRVVAGDLLIGPPCRPYDPFHRTVILLCSHDEEGSFGLIINRPTSLTINSLIGDDMGDHVVHYGGPVGMDHLTFIHRCYDDIRESMPVMDGIFYAGNMDDMVLSVQKQAIMPHQIRFCLGYSGWEPGQLEQELQHDYWFITRAEASVIFEDDSSTLWKSLLIEMGGPYAAIANYPHHPSLN